MSLATNPEALLRDVATALGITDGAVQHITGDLERAGVIIRLLRVGRRRRQLSWIPGILTSPPTRSLTA